MPGAPLPPEPEASPFSEAPPPPPAPPGWAPFAPFCAALVTIEAAPPPPPDPPVQKFMHSVWVAASTAPGLAPATTPPEDWPWPFSEPLVPPDAPLLGL